MFEFSDFLSSYGREQATAFYLMHTDLPDNTAHRYAPAAAILFLTILC